MKDGLIRFRGKKFDPVHPNVPVTDLEWIYGNYTMLYDKPNILYEKDIDPRYGGGIGHEIYPNTGCQYIGLQDKKGTDIYEGDILEREIENGICEVKLVMYNPEHGAFELFDSPYQSAKKESITKEKLENMLVVGDMFDGVDYYGNPLINDMRDYLGSDERKI